MRSLLNPRCPPPPPLAALLLSPFSPLKPATTHFRRKKPFFHRPPTGSRTLASMAKTIDEPDVGISCYVSSLLGFRGILKQRYSDFIVNEVSLDGTIVHLTSFDIPLDDSEAGEKEEIDASSGDKDYSLELEAFQLLCGETDANALKSLLDKVLAAEDDTPPIVLSPDLDKAHRAEVHNFFKKHFKFLVTDTVEESEGSVKRVRVRFSGAGSKDRRGKKRKDIKDDRPFDSRGSENWPEHRGKFLRFNLYKENKETQEALAVIGKMLGIQQRSFGFSGTKDKRSISTQMVTIFKMHAKRLAALNNRLFGIKVGNFCYVKEGLSLGQLLGNRFTIILRDVAADSENHIKDAANGLGKNGFINYYGLQRFGCGSVPTHLVGGALFRGEWKDAVSLILDPREGERENIKEVREHYKEHGDIDLALRKFPRYLVAERAILQYLKKCPGNYLQALKAVPRTLRMMYVHSYQSYLWNHAASMRMQKYGISQVVLGDLVFCKGSSPAELDNASNLNPKDDCNDLDNCTLDLSEEVLQEEKVQSVKVVDSEDLLKGVYTIEDVVLPLPGSKVIYPANEIADVYQNMAKKDGISLTESSHGVKEFAITDLKGAYRRVFQRPMDFIWELSTYTDGHVSLVESDYDLIRKRGKLDLPKEEVFVNETSLNQTKGADSEDLLVNCSVENKSESGVIQAESTSESPKLALKLEFTLPASCYATMAIRELLKASTSVNYQKSLNA